jgi:hypothetical protein
MTLNAQRIALLLAVGFAITTVACQQEAQQADEPATAAVEAVPVVVQEVLIGAGKDDPSGVPKALTPKDDVQLSLKTNASSKSATLEVKLFEIGAGRLVEQRNATIPPNNLQPVALVFKSETGWNPGRYMFEIKLDGKLIEQRDFDIHDPESADPS